MRFKRPRACRSADSTATRSTASSCGASANDTGEQLAEHPGGAALPRDARRACSTTRPSATCARWDELCRTRRVVAHRRPRRAPVRQADRPGRAGARDGVPPLVSPAALDTCWCATRARRETSTTTASWFMRRCARAAATSPPTPVAPAGGFQFPSAEGVEMGSEVEFVGQPGWTSSCRGPPRCGCCATGPRWRRGTAAPSDTLAESPGVYRVEAHRRAPRAAGARGSSRTRCTCDDS